MAGPNVFNMPSGVPFLPALAEGLSERFGDRLSDALILLPTRRAIRRLADILAGQDQARLLPELRTLADIDPDEPPFEPGYLTGIVDPALSPAERRFSLAEIVGRFHQNTTGEMLDASARLALADPLMSVLDDAAMDEVALDALDQLDDIQSFAARHFQNAAEFYKVLQFVWPELLAEKREMEPMARRVALLDALTELWTMSPPGHPVIIAGSTGTLKATARLMRCVARLPQGLVVLPGLDRRETDDVWKNIKDDHPQKSLDRLISVIGIKRDDVPDWTRATATGPREARRRLISESLVPVEDTADWRGRIERLRDGYVGGDFFEHSVEGLALVEARTETEEALVIALAMRSVLTKKDKTAILVTPDVALARRVKARLRRWNVNVDYSQGQPLEETRIGGFLAQILDLVRDPYSPVQLSVLFNHPLTGLSEPEGTARSEWQSLEPQIFRGPRPHPDQFEHESLFHRLYEILGPMDEEERKRDAAHWAKQLTLVAELIATSEPESGRARLWIDADGESAAGLLDDLIRHGAALGTMDLAEFSRLFSRLMRGRVVRPRYGTHPRLQILGPIEARMVSADLVILGGLNEGIWPASPGVHPFLSRGMRQAMGLSLPERRYGLAAHDFSMLAAHKDVLLTRAERSADAPHVASRWIWRLKTLLKGALGQDRMEALLEPSEPLLTWARQLDAVPMDTVEPAPPPMPKPPLEARWPGTVPKLSITQIKTWIRDPYSIYARYVLGLRSLDPLDAEPGAAQFGSAVHKALENFTREFPKHFPPNAQARLTQAFENEFIASGINASELARERVRLERMAAEWLNYMRSSRESGFAPAGVEIEGRMELRDPPFVLIGYADLIERDGTGYRVTDYKTGAPPTAKVVAAGFDPQLPLTAWMIDEGAFDRLLPLPVQDVRYVRLRGVGDGVSATSIQAAPGKKGASLEALVETAQDTLTRLVRLYNDPDTPYPSQPRIQFTHDYGEYDQLARRGEWALAADPGAEGTSS